ncbi:MAG: HAMP domain-containing histidine kinase [Prevotella sp.]|nr:HAMP domain-containing histidine kinase [Prevotella sp.]
MKRLLILTILLIQWFTLYAEQAENKEVPGATLAEIEQQIAREQKAGNVEEEGLARWRKMDLLKNLSLTEKLVEEAVVQMEWFRKHGQWDNYYRTWQLKTNALSALGKLKQSLQETQQMLDDAKERNNKLGRAMAYKQIGVIYLNMKQTDLAVEALQDYAELIKGEEGDYSMLSSVYYRMAKAYDYDKNYHKELRLTNEWLAFLHTKVGKVKVAEVRECYNACYLARAAAFIGLDQLDNAKMALDTAEHHAHLINRALSLHHYYKMRARYYLAEGEAAKALVYTDSVSMMTNDKDDHAEEVKALALLKLGRSAEAAHIYQRLYYEKDSIFGRDARQHLDELNTLFQVDELEAEQQRTRFRYTIIAAASIVLALLVLLIFGWRSALRQKRVNEKLRIANEQAKASSKMKTEFIRNISHEIRTPLNILSGFTQILTSSEMELPEDEKLDIQRQVMENADRITNIVDRMLELSDASSEALIERNDLTDVLNIVAQAIEHSRIALHTRPGNPDSKVTFENIDDETAASMTLHTNKLFAVRTLAQLLENAVKFTSEGSIKLYMERADNKIRLIVEDTGIGIPADQAESIFEEFVQLDAFTDGTGIGLTVARSIAQRMGGDLWFDTSYTQGARFVFELLKN